MKKAIIIAALLCGTAHAEFLDGNKLLARINGDTIEYASAIGYIMGVSDALRGQTHCPPTTVTSGQITDMVKQQLTNYPSLRHMSGDAHISYLLNKTWPCPKKGGGT